MTARPRTTVIDEPEVLDEVAEDSQPGFSWTSPSTGAVVTIASTALPNSGYWRKARKLDELDAMYTLLETIATPDEVESTDGLPPAEVIALMSAWTKAMSGGATPGESASSSA